MIVEFPYTWKQCKLGELLKTNTFKNFISSPCENGEYAVIQQGDVPIIGYANGDPYKQYDNVVLFGDHTLSLYKPKAPFFLATDGLKILSGKDNMNGYFLLYLLECYKPQSEGYKRHYSVLKDKECFFTLNKSEQKQIGDFFQCVDTTITLHQRKEFINSVKGKFCPSKNFLVGNPGKSSINNSQKAFTWKQCKLGEVSNKVSKKNQDIVVDEVFTNSAEFGIISQRDYFEKDIANNENIDGYYVVEPDDFVYNPRISTLAPFGPIRRNNLKRRGAMSPLYYVFKAHDVDFGYLEYFFYTNGWHRYMKLNGNSGARSDRFAIRDEVFREMPIPLPQDIEEQKQIGIFFKSIDYTITLHQRRLVFIKEHMRC